MKYLALLLFIFAAIAHSQAPAYGYIRGRVNLTDNFPVSSLPVYLNNNTVYTDDNGKFITLQKSGNVKITFQSNSINVNLPSNEIINVDIYSSPVGVVINNYSEDKMPSSVRLDNEDITDIRYVNNSIWLPQCYNKSGSLTIFHNNEYSVPYDSSSTYILVNNINLQKFIRKVPVTGSISIKNFKVMPDNFISFRYLQGNNIWRTSVIKIQKFITNLPINDYFLISFNSKNDFTSKRLYVDLKEGNKEVSFSALPHIDLKSIKIIYQDTKGFYRNTTSTASINRPILNDKLALCDNKSTDINYEDNTSIKFISNEKPEQYTRYKWMVYEDDQWRVTESEWLYDKGQYPSAIINKLTSGTSRDFIVYSTSNYIPKVWSNNNLIIPYPDYSPIISMQISLTELPNLKGKVSRNKGELPPTSRLTVSPVDIKPILKNLTPEIERELRLYNVNFDINTGDFNIILPGYGKYLLKFYTSDRSFPENEIIIEKNEENSCINFSLKQ